MSKQSSKRYVGILGGMGPEATVLLMSRIIAKTAADDDADHVPLLVDNNTQVPSRIRALVEKSGDDPGPVLVEMARRLAACGAEALAMPCNTAHHYAPLLVRSVAIPFLDMIELSADRVADLPGRPRRVGLLASPAVRQTGIFDRALSARDIETRYPVRQDQMLACIRAIKANRRDETTDGFLLDASSELQAAGADVLVVACSEFSIIADLIPRKIPVIDTIDVLAEAVVAFSSGGPHHGVGR